MRWHALVHAGLALHLVAMAPGTSAAQPTTAALTDSARRLDALALALQQPPLPANRRRAAELWTNAAALYRQVGDRAREGDMLRNAALRHSSIDTALAYLHAALGLARETGDRVGEGRALFHLGTSAYGRGQHDSARALLPHATQIAREVGARWDDRAAVFQSAGWILWQLSDLDAADAHLREALALARAAGNRGAESSALGDLGNVFAQRGRHDSTFAYFDAALAIERATGDRRGEALWLYNLGALHANYGHPDSALVYLRSSLALARAVGWSNITAASLNGIGNMLRDLGHPDSALVVLREAEQVARAHQLHGVLAEVLWNLGKEEQRQRRSDSARARFQDARALYQRLGRAHHVALMLAAIAEIHEAVGRIDSARVTYHEGLALARQAHSPQTEGELLYGIGAFHARAGAHHDLARAVAYYDSAAAIRGTLLTSVGVDGSRVSYAETSAALHERWALAWLARAPQIGERQSILAALAVAERGRAQALLELLRRSGSGDGARGPPGAARGTAPGADLVREGEAVAARARVDGAPILALLATPDTLVSWLVLPSGEVAVARQAIGRDSVGRLVAAVRAALGVDEVGARALRGMEPLAGLRTADAATHEMPRARHRRTAFLGQLTSLTLPFELTRRLPASGDLVIVASGPLALVPFAALSAGAAGEPLGVRHAVRYAPSIATLAVLQAATPGTSTRHDAMRRALVVGNPAMPGVRSSTGRMVRLPALPGAEREARWVADALGVTPVTGRDAGERAVRDRLAEAPVIHLATHGFAFSAEARTLDSFVAFAADSASDGLLTVGEVLDAGPRMVAELVVLSACQTGLGNLKQAEGTVGLQRAFLAKGARSVLVSLWSVSDEATELLMRRFYTHWLKDTDHPGKAEALRRAQRDVRATPRFREPRYWAAFQLVGAP